MCEASIDEAQSILTALENQRFDLSALRPIFSSISPLALCKRWHKIHADSLRDKWLESAGKAYRRHQELQQAARNAEAIDLHHGPVANTADHNDEMHSPQSATTYGECQSITVGDLRGLRIPRELGPNGRPVSLRRSSGARSRCLLLSFKLTSERNHSENCPICLDELQDHPDESMYIKCDRCHRSSHLGCSDAWLASDTFADMHCPFWYEPLPGWEKLRMKANLYNSRTSTLFHAVSYVTSTEASSVSVQAQSRPRSSRLGERSAQPSPRRSVRQRRAPDRFTP
jgi:hypothetical protein